MSFTVTVGHTQVDGRKYVLEVHSDAQGEFSRVEYLSAVGADTDAIATARNAQLLIQFADQEVQSAVDDDTAPTTRFQTIDEFLSRLRGFFGNARSTQACRIALWVVKRLQDGTVTPAQLRTAFNLNVARWNTLQTKMQTISDALLTVEEAEGE